MDDSEGTRVEGLKVIVMVIAMAMVVVVALVIAMVMVMWKALVMVIVMWKALVMVMVAVDGRVALRGSEWVCIECFETGRVGGCFDGCVVCCHVRACRKSWGSLCCPAVRRGPTSGSLIRCAA